MNTRLDYAEVIRKLEEHIGKDPDFNASEMAALHEMVQAWKGWQSLGKATKWVVVGLGAVAGFATVMIGAWNAIKGLIK